MLSLSFSSVKPRLSSLTIGDSERKSSATQQREPTADVLTESTGNCDFPRWFIFLFQDRFRISLYLISLNILQTLLPSLCPPLTGPGLVQRCVVVQKDHLGFGFTVCGERVKLVQNVRLGETHGHSWRVDVIVMVILLFYTQMLQQTAMKSCFSSFYDLNWL